MAARHGHRAAYHGVRSPFYFAKSLGFAIWGVVTVVRRLIAWWHIPGTTRLEWDAAANGQLNEHLRLHKQGRETRTARGINPRALPSRLAVAVVAIVVYMPWWAWALTALAAFVAFALAGRPQGKTITTRAVLPAEVAPPTPDVIVRALGSLGIAGINQVLRNGEQINFPSPVREDGPGWRFEVDLPYGVTATQVIERREQFASGLRRPLGAVWPEVVSHEHAGRLEGWVGRADISKARPAPWPWLRTGGGNVFAPLPFGASPRDAASTVGDRAQLAERLDARQGKTRGARAGRRGGPRPDVELWLHELKGTGDLDGLSRLAPVHLRHR